MAAKILLISVNRCATPYRVFPLGLAHVAASLAAAGHAVSLADFAENPEGAEEAVRSFVPDYVGLSLRNLEDNQMQDPHPFAADLCAAANKVRSVTQAPLIVGGSGFSLFPERLLADCGAEFGIRGEGEESIVRLLAALDSKGDYRSVPGLVYRENGAIANNEPERCAATSIRAPLLPPALARFYIRESSMLNVQTQRGCAYACCYCTYPLLEGTGVRLKDPVFVAEELERIRAAGARYFFIVDSVFNSSEAHVAGVCEEILRRGLKLSWGCFLRPCGLSRGLVELMARAGLSHIEFGTDSLSDRVLWEYGKAFTFADVHVSSDLARAAGVHYAHSLIIGGPGETEETMREGFENSTRLRKTVYFPYAGMRVYPGTPVYFRALAEGTVTAETDLLPPFFYANPALPRDRMLDLLGGFSKRSRNWIVWDIPEENAKVMEKLRGMGVAGPLWEFLAQ
jgi:radical SAM superfamily enzyme YgiQ (UPF0313 family)